MAPNKKASSSASKFGQIIGEAFEHVVVEFIENYLASTHSEFVLLQPEDGKKIITLEMFGGLARAMDNVIVLEGTEDPVALLETKWLKDGRHHNDKGAWILQLREVRKKHATIRGAAAILLGFWTEGVGLMLSREGDIRMVLVATDEQVYGTLQKYLNQHLGSDTFHIDAREMRVSLIRPDDLAALATHLKESKKLDEIARSWLKIESTDEDGNTITGSKKIAMALDEILAPLPEHPTIAKFEISLRIDTGNTIYQEFTDMEAAREFMEKYFRDPKAILDQITPGRRSDTKE